VRISRAEPLEDRVRAFFEAWCDGDLTALAEFFAPGLTMTDVARGVRFDLSGTMAMLGDFLQRSPQLRIELQSTACHGDRVFTERIDRMVLGGRPVALPVAAIFTFTGMQISEWREYYDRGTLGNVLENS
jgi:limonene-1,2-epoxide hydrolase